MTQTYATPAALAAAYRPACPAADAALAAFRRPSMPRDVRFALVREPLKPLAKPVAFDSAAQLAAAIHRDRQGEPIQLVEDVALHVQGWGELTGVAVFTLTEGGEQHRYIGWIWLDGGGRAQLQAALARVVSSAPTIGRAA